MRDGAWKGSVPCYRPRENEKEAVLEISDVMPGTWAVVSDPGFAARFNALDHAAICGFAVLLAELAESTAADYDRDIAGRLSQLDEIRFEPDDTPYNASSKDTYIVFFKPLSGETRRRILHHELFHFIQKPGSVFEDFPPGFAFDESGYEPLLFEEAFVQYMASAINGFPDEKIFVGEDGTARKYWLNEAYRGIVGFIEDLQDAVGYDMMLRMYLDDGQYVEAMHRYDDVRGEGAFTRLFAEICRLR